MWYGEHCRDSTAIDAIDSRTTIGLISKFKHWHPSYNGLLHLRHKLKKNVCGGGGWETSAGAKNEEIYMYIMYNRHNDEEIELQWDERFIFDWI